MTMSQKISKQDKSYSVNRFRRVVFETPTGKPTRSSGYEYIKYGDDNKYPQFLDTLLQQPEHSAIAEAKIDWVAREGFDISNLMDTTQEWFIENDMNDFVYKIARDYELYGGFCFFVIKRRDGNGVAVLEYEDFSNVRVSDTSDDEEDEFLVSKNWGKIRTTDVERYSPYSEDTTEDKTLFYFVGNSKAVYPSPRYYGAIPAIQTGIEIDNFHLNHVKNGFFIPLVINFNQGIPEQERQDEIVRDVKLAFAGTDNAGDPLISFNNDKESAVSIESFEPADLDKKFEILNSQVTQKIYTGHRVTSPMLFGLRSEGQLGGRSELVEAWEIFKKNYILPTQHTLCSVIKSVLGIEDMELTLITIPPIEEELDKEVLTIEERRQLQGIEDGEISDQQKTIMAISQLPQSLQDKFIEQLTPEEIFQLVGYTRQEQEIDTEE